MRLNAVSLFNINTNYTAKAKQNNHSGVNFKRLEKDITDFTNSKKDTERYVKTLFAYDCPICPANINDNFEIKKSKEGFEFFKLKTAIAGCPSDVSFFNNGKDLLEHLKQNKMKYKININNDDNIFISYSDKKMNYGLFYDKKTLKFQSGYANTDLSKIEVSLIKKDKDLSLYYRHCNDNIYNGELFNEKTIIEFDPSMKVKKTETVTHCSTSTIEKTAEFNKNGSLRKFNKKEESFG